METNNNELELKPETPSKRGRKRKPSKKESNDAAATKEIRISEPEKSTISVNDYPFEVSFIKSENECIGIAAAVPGGTVTASSRSEAEKLLSGIIQVHMGMILPPKPVVVPNIPQSKQTSKNQKPIRTDISIDLEYFLANSRMIRAAGRYAEAGFRRHATDSKKFRMTHDEWEKYFNEYIKAPAGR